MIDKALYSLYLGEHATIAENADGSENILFSSHYPGFKQFIRLYNDCFGMDAADDSVQNYLAKGAAENGLEIFRKPFSKNGGHVELLCDVLIRSGHIFPLLALFFDLYRFDDPHCSDHVSSKTHYLQTLCDRVAKFAKHTNTQLTRTGRFADSLCEDFIKWLNDEFKAGECIKNLAMGSYSQRFIRENFVDPGINLEEILETVKLAFSDNNSFSHLLTASWVTNCCIGLSWKNPSDVSCVIQWMTDYILPAFCAIDPDDFTRAYEVYDPEYEFTFPTDDKDLVDTYNYYPLYKCVYEDVAAHITCLLSLVLPISCEEDFITALKENAPIASGSFTANSTAAYVSAIREKGLLLSDICRTRYKGFGETLYSFLSAAKVNFKKNDSEKERALEKAELFQRLSASDIGFSVKTISFLAAVNLFAEGAFDKGVEMLLDIFNDAGYLEWDRYTKAAELLLLAAFFESEDFNQKMRLYSTIHYEQARRIQAYGDTDECEEQLFPDSLMDEVEHAMLGAVKRYSKTFFDDFSALKQKEDYTALQSKIDDEQSTIQTATRLFFADKRSAYAKELQQAATEFLKARGEQSCDIYAALPDDIRRTIHNNLLLSGTLYDLHVFLESEGETDTADYSAATLPLTKALEVLGNYIFQRAVQGESFSSVGSNVQKHYGDRSGWSDSIALGSVAFLFVHNYFTTGNAPLLFKVIDEAKLKKLKGIDLELDFSDSVFTGLQPYNLPQPCCSVFTDDAEYNRKLLYAALHYITQKYRNKCCHKDALGKAAYEACRDMTAMQKHVLWILLYLVTPEVPSANN